MNSTSLRVRALILPAAAAVVLLLPAARRAHAQMPPAGAGAPAQAPQLTTPIPASTLKGVVMDTLGKPVPHQQLSLHRVNETGGAMVDSATTDAQGRFSVKVPAETDTSAVLFVATRWNGQLYIGTPFKPPAQPGASYTVTVGVNPVNMGPPAGAGGQATGPMAGTGAAAPAAAPSDSSTAVRWFVAIVLALIALGAIVYALVGAARERARQRRREILARIAALDERAQSARGDEAARLEHERAELVAELTSE